MYTTDRKIVQETILFSLTLSSLTLLQSPPQKCYITSNVLANITLLTKLSQWSLTVLKAPLRPSNQATDLQSYFLSRTEREVVVRERHLKSTSGFTTGSAGR